jgi:hypothetical protein
MDPVVHFQMPAEDRERAARFYGEAFGWSAEHMGEEMGSYTVVTTTPSGPDGRPSTPGAINGGFYQRPQDPSGQAPGVVIAVDDVERSMAAVEGAGGRLAGVAEEIPGVGVFASFFDTEGNRVGMLQPNPPGASAAA